MAESFPTRINIYQNGHSDISFRTALASESLALPPYWMWRVGVWGQRSGIEFETIHHKLYAENLPDEVQYFSITHGYNFLFINYARKLNEYTWRLGGGLALAHPENKVRGKALEQNGPGIWNEGYYITGPSLHASLGKRFYYSRIAYVNTEVKLTYGYADIPVVEGNATLHNLALHLAIGLGLDVFKKK